MTIDDAVALALKGNRQVQSAALDVARAREATAATKTQRYPQFNIFILSGEPLRRINFTIPPGVLGTYAATGPIPAQASSISTARQVSALLLGQATQPLSQLWKLHLSLISSQINEDLAQERLRRKRQDTAQSVRELYYQIAQTQTQIESAEANETTLLGLQRETEQKSLELAVLKSDSLTVRARLSRQRYELVNLRDTGKTQKESFNRLLGRDLETGFSVEVEPPPKAEEIDLAAAYNLALHQRPEIQETRLQIDKAEMEVRSQRAEYIPDISLGFTYVSFPNISFLPQNLMVAGLTMQWQQPFDWGQKRHKTQSLRDGVKQAILTERDTQQQILIDVSSKFRALAEARMLLDTTSLAQEAQREGLREATNRYREKAVLLSDFLRQDAALVQADSDYQNALSALWKAKADFDRALGREY